MLNRGLDFHQAVTQILVQLPLGRVLDVGTGKGEMARIIRLYGYEVAACDLGDQPPWNDCLGIAYQSCDLNEPLPYPDESFDYAVCLEVIEHVENPFALCRELRRILRPGGRVVISTPNILNMKSRIRFFLEGNYEFFKYPPIEWEKDGAGANVHVNPIRLHELEYYIHKSGMQLERVCASQRSYGWRIIFPFELLVRFQSWWKIRRSLRPGEIPLVRLYAIILSDQLLYGWSLVVVARRSEAGLDRGRMETQKEVRAGS